MPPLSSRLYFILASLSHNSFLFWKTPPFRRRGRSFFVNFPYASWKIAIVLLSANRSSLFFNFLSIEYFSVLSHTNLVRYTPISTNHRPERYFLIWKLNLPEISKHHLLMSRVNASTIQARHLLYIDWKSISDSYLKNNLVTKKERPLCL